MKTMRLVWALAASLGFLFVTQANAQVDVTNPGDPIVVVSGTNDGDGNSGAPPAAEGVDRAIDNVGQKYLNFLDLGSGFAVTPSGNPSNLPLIGIRLFTANDAVDRDPASFVLSGSNDSINGPWTAIASGDLALPSGRNPGGAAIPTFNQTVLFANTNSYTHYQLIFPTLKNAAAANSMQIGDVELLVPEPTTAALTCLGLIAVAAITRRKRA